MWLTGALPLKCVKLSYVITVPTLQTALLFHSLTIIAIEIHVSRYLKQQHCLALSALICAKSIVEISSAASKYYEF
jgi:hypothetical protein